MPSSLEKELKKLFDTKSELVIFDIGSCEGEDSIKYAKLFPNAKIYAVEALPSNLPLLYANLVKYSTTNVEVLPIALSEQKGRASFYVSSGHPENCPVTNDWNYGNKSSSLLAPDQVGKYHPWLKFNEVIEVETDTLENICQERNINNIDFIHLDVQGAELKVLKGAGDILKTVKAIWLEVESVELYKEQPLNKDIEIFMNDNNFIKIKDTLESCSGDQLYINKKKINKYFLLDLTFKSIKKYFLKLANFKLVKRVITKRNKKVSYSQCGEDLIIKFIFETLGIRTPSYIDIGAHNPEYLSNTAIFYKNCSSGINIEPEPTLFKAFLKARKRDINLNIGVSDLQGEIDFYIMSAPTLNTFSKNEADKYTNEGYYVESIKKVEVDTINNVITNYCKGNFPDFLSLDVEGLDFEILKSIDYDKSVPTVMCVETISFSETGNGVKDKQIINFLESKGYMVYADTYINTIFVKKDRWIR